MFEGQMTRRQWNEFITASPAAAFPPTDVQMRLIPNLNYIGLLSPRMQKHYEAAGLWQFASGKTPASSMERTCWQICSETGTTRCLSAWLSPDTESFNALTPCSGRRGMPLSARPRRVTRLTPRYRNRTL